MEGKVVYFYVVPSQANFIMSLDEPENALQALLA